MSIMGYDLPRRYQSHDDLCYPNYYFDGRNASLALSRHARVDPRGYQVGGPVGGARGQLGMERDEPTYDHGGHSRRRIAVACARCRRRKIKCSGDSGNGSGCTACKGAGISASLCQFHRVGSDNVQKVIDSLQTAQSLTNMANSSGVMSIYPTIPTNSTYSRSMTTPTYPSAWTVHYSEDASAVENYGLDQSAEYLSDPVAMTNTSMYGTAYNRWTCPPSRPYQQATSMYYDQQPSYSVHGLPYTPSKTRGTAMNEHHSTMDMSSLQLTLPERPHPRRNRTTECSAPRRQLPFPQPSSAQTSRNALDNQQDQRLRSGQNSNSSRGTGTTLIKSPSWTSGSDGPVSMSTTAPLDTSTHVTTTADGALNFLATAAIEDVTATIGNTPHLGLDFNSSSLIDHLTAPAPATPYSNFRASQSYRQPSTQGTRHDSQTNLYSFTPSKASKRDSLDAEDSEDFKLVNGRRYTPLTHLQPQTSSAPDSLQRESFDNRDVSLHRSSIGNLNATF